MVTSTKLQCTHNSLKMKVLLYLPLFIFPIIKTKYLEGVIKTRENWAFLSRFCFLSEQGQFEYFLEFNEDRGIPNLLLYYDTDDQWPAIYKTGKSCYEKEAVLHTEQKQVINLTATDAYYRDLSRCSYLVGPNGPMTTQSSVKTTPTINVKSQYENITTKATIRRREVPQRKKTVTNATVLCHNALKFRSARARWWFIALSNCNSTKGIQVSYKILMTNGPPGDYWHEHFSADEFYILPVLMGFCVAYSFLTLGIIICSLELKSRQLLHSTYKIFVASAFLQLFGIVFTSATYVRYSINGLGPSKVRRFGLILMGSSETLYLLLLLLLAKGYTITRGRLPIPATVKITIFLCLYVVTYVSIFIYEAQVFDPGEVLYLYESPAGYGLITLRMLAWVMFVYSTIFTLKHYPEKSNFYYPFNMCGTVWFVAGPAFILSANTYIDKWVRESIVCAVLQFITFGGHLTFLLLTLPSVANKNFPYHVRTTQIGIMEVSGTSGISTIEQFGHHAYQPTREQPIIVPLTRRTEEIFEGMYNQPVLNLEEEHFQNRRNLIMDNVVSWSIAKNVESIEMPRNTTRMEANEIERPLTNHSSEPNHEVPIELFTISKSTNQE